MDECFAMMTNGAYRLIMRVVQEAVYGGPLDKESPVIKDLYKFLESKDCRLIMI